MINLHEAYLAGKMPTVERRVEQIAKSVKRRFVGEVADSVPAWWGRMALSTRQGGGGGILMQKVAGGWKIFYANLGRYNYLEVIEKGRGSYSIKDALLRSPRARSGRHGRYIIIPLKGDDVDEAPVAVRSGFYKDAEGIKRNKYRVLQAGKGNTVKFVQKTKNGNQYKSIKFVVVSAKSKGWMYPAIPPNPISKRLQADVDAMLQDDVGLRRAIDKDASSLIEAALKKLSD